MHQRHSKRLAIELQGNHGVFHTNHRVTQTVAGGLLGHRLGRATERDRWGSVSGGHGVSALRVEGCCSGRAERSQSSNSDRRDGCSSGGGSSRSQEDGSIDVSEQRTEHGVLHTRQRARGEASDLLSSSPQVLRLLACRCCNRQRGCVASAPVSIGLAGNAEHPLRGLNSSIDLRSDRRRSSLSAALGACRPRRWSRHSHPSIREREEITRARQQHSPDENRAAQRLLVTAQAHWLHAKQHQRMRAFHRARSIKRIQKSRQQNV